MSKPPFEPSPFKTRPLPIPTSNPAIIALTSGSLFKGSKKLMRWQISSPMGKAMLTSNVFRMNFRPTNIYPRINKMALQKRTIIDTDKGIDLLKRTLKPVTPPTAKFCGKTIMPIAMSVRATPNKILAKDKIFFFIDKYIGWKPVTLVMGGKPRSRT